MAGGTLTYGQTFRASVASGAMRADVKDADGFDFVKLGVGDFFGRDAELAGGEVAVLVGVDAVEECGDEFADWLAVGLLFHIGVPRVAAISGKARYLSAECAGEIGMDDM